MKLLSLSIIILFAAAVGAETLRITDSSRGGSSALRQAALEFSLSTRCNIRIDRMAASSAAGLTAKDTVDLAVWEISDTPEKFKKNHSLPLGCEALVIYVNASNPLPSLTVSEAKEIFCGLRPRWSELGGKPRDIHRINLKNTADFSGLDREVLGAFPAAEVLGVGSSRDVMLITGADPDAMGFAHMTSTDNNVRIVPVNDIMPTKENVCSGRYPLARRYVLVMVKKSAVAEKFIAFLKKKIGSRIRQDMWIPFELNKSGK